MSIIKNKKGLELSLNVVIIGIILLFVMLVVLYIFSTQMGKQGSFLDNLINDTTESSDNPSRLLDRFRSKDENANTQFIPYLVPLIPFSKIKRK